MENTNKFAPVARLQFCREFNFHKVATPNWNGGFNYVGFSFNFGIKQVAENVIKPAHKNEPGRSLQQNKRGNGPN